MNRDSHIIYNKAVLCYKNGNHEIFTKILTSLDLTRTEVVLLKSRELIGKSFYNQARQLLLKLNVSNSHFLNAERAILMGHCYVQLHDTMKCRYSYSAALKEYILCRDRKGQFLCHLLLGRNLLEGGLMPLSLSHLNEAKSVALGSHEETLVARHLAKLYIKTGNEQKALLQIETVLQHTDSLSKKENQIFRQLAFQFYNKIGQSTMAEKAISNLAFLKTEH